MDRVDRKRAMIGLDALNVVILSVPLVATFGQLSVWWIYAVAFIQSTVFIAFQAGEFAAIPSLVETDDLVAANGRIQATYSAAQVAGPLLGGLLVAFVSIQWVMALDAASFLISAVMLSMIRGSFNAPAEGEPREADDDPARHRGRAALRVPPPRAAQHLADDGADQLRRRAAYTQLVLFADERLDVGPRGVGLLFAAGSAGVVVTGLLAGRLRRRFSFTALAMTSLMLMGAMQIVFAGTTWFWLALPLWATASGLGILFNINTGSLRQAIVPNHLLSRILSIAAVLAWSRSRWAPSPAAG